jgi:hypothetical protein
MTPHPPLAQAGIPAFVASLPTTGLVPSWVGPGPHPDWFCIGTESNTVRFIDVNGVTTGDGGPISPRTESVTGVAFADGWMAISNRSEVAVWSLLPADGDQHRGFQLDVGAHNVVAGRNGRFFAAAGRTGILCLRASPRGVAESLVRGDTGNGILIYQVVTVQPSDGTELLVCATRKAGVAFAEVPDHEQSHILNTRTFGKLDIVDVCPLNLAGYPAGVIAAGLEGSIVVFDDVRASTKPPIIKFPSLQGKVYRVMSVGGTICVLTSQSLVIYVKLAEQMAAGMTSVKAETLTIRMKAVDANTVADRWVLAVLPDGLLRFDMNQLTMPTESGFGLDRSEARFMEAHDVDWDQRSERMTASVMAMS